VEFGRGKRKSGDELGGRNKKEGKGQKRHVSPEFPVMMTAFHQY